MSTNTARSLAIEDESLDVAAFTTVPFDESVDWTDDNEAVLAEVKIGETKVYINRADLRELRDFLTEVLVDDSQLHDVNEDEEEDR